MNHLSQRDPRWAHIQLGTSNLTIGQGGCTITSLAMIIGTTPDVVNERLKSLPPDAQGNTGYAKGNLIYWARVSEAFPGVTINRAWSYDNDVVKNNLPAIVQVDGSPIGAPIHFVVYIGNQELIDPWTGTIRPTHSYSAQSYALVKGQWIQDKNYIDQLRSQIEATTQCQSQLKVALEQNTNYQKELDSYISQLKESKLREEEYRKKYEDEQRTVLNLKDEISKIHQQDRDYGKEALDAQHLANDRGDFLKMIGEAMDVQYDPTNDKQLVDEVLEKIAQQQKEQQIANIPEVGQLNLIVKQLVSMGINNYLETKGYEPLDLQKTDPQLNEKVHTYLVDLTNELLGQGDAATVRETIKKPRESIIKRVTQSIINFIFITK